MKAFRALTVSTVRASFRNRTALIFTLGLAFLFMVIFGELFSGGAASVTIGVIDNDGSAQSQAFISALGSVSGVTVEKGDAATEADHLNHDKIAAYLTIPHGFGTATSENPQTVEIKQASTMSTSASIADQIVGNIVNGFGYGGAKPTVKLATPTTTSINTVAAIDYMLPSLIAYIILQSGINFVAIGLVELRTRKVLRRFRASPLGSGQILASQVTAGAVTVVLQLVVLVAVGVVAFQAKNYGNWLVALVPMILGTGAFVGIGFLLTSAARTGESARGLATLVALPMMFLSGIFFPVDSFPQWLQSVIHILPLTWLSDAMHKVMNDGAGLTTIAGDCIVLAAWAIVTMSLATWRFRWD